MERKQLTDKILVLGVDGMDPRLAKYLMDQGKMPNLKKYMEKGAAREDMVLQGAHPTVTPPMWTTLATGAYVETHGITAFHNAHPTKLGTRVYSLDSRLCKAEPIWNVFAEAGKKTLVWHWPGSSWPPTSTNENLHVVDGTQPAAINMGVGLCDWESVVIADEKIESVRFIAHDAVENTGAGCVLTDLEDTVADADAATKPSSGQSKGADRAKGVFGQGSGSEIISYMMDDSDSEIETLGSINVNKTESPIKAPTGWADAPEDAKEFTIIHSNGYVRRPALILKNEQGIYDTVAIYTSKKSNEPIAVIKNGDIVFDVVDEVMAKDVKKVANRNYALLDLAEDGSSLKLWVTYALAVESDAVWHPKTLHAEVVENVGVVPAVSLSSAKNPILAEKVLLKAWDHYCQWQADAIEYLMGSHDVIFSHLHNVDGIGHQLWHFAKYREEWGQDAGLYQSFLDYTYKQTDDYLGQFLPYLDKGWTIIITSDHGLICEEHHSPGLGEAGVNGTVMKDLGYTVFKKDENGNDLREIDFTKTKAVAFRGCHINLNLKSRYEYGIVSDEEKYDLEAQIITDLYGYKDKHTGKRIVSMALRRKDAALFGMNSEECGDIIFFIEEGYNIIHMDSLSTQEGYYHTSVSPIFVAAGPGIKENFRTQRVIRQVDVAPTIAVLGGIRMPKECEGAPAYQIFAE